MEVLHVSKKPTMAKKQQSVTDSTRPPLVPTEKNNNAVTHHRRTRSIEVSSRYRSPTPTKTRTCPPSTQRSVSAERKRSLIPSYPSTPVSDVSIDSSTRRLSTGSLLWPSTMRSLSVSFQSDSVSVPLVVKKEKPLVTSNIASKQQRKRSPLKGQSENSKPVDGTQSRIIEQHQWPSRVSGKISSKTTNRSLDLGDKTARRRMSLPLSKLTKPLHKSTSDAAARLSSFYGLVMSPTSSEDGHRVPLARFQPLSAPGTRAPSPSRSSLSSSSSSNSRGMSPSRGVSPLRGLSPSRGANLISSIPSPRGVKSSIPSPRGVSPSRIRQTNGSAQSSSNVTSVLSFFADVKKGKKTSYIEDVHQLRLLYNRHSQWRFANARAERVSYIQRLIAEETLYNVWHATSDLRDLVTAQRICLQQMKLEIKLESILKDQMVCLKDWAMLEREHISSLSGAIGDLEANTLRLPLTGGTKADLGSLKLAMSSALDVMEAMGSSIRSLYSQMEEMNKFVSDLSFIATKENFMFNKCQDLLASTSVMEIEERSLMTHLIQKKQKVEVRDDAESPLLPLSKFS